MKEALHYEKKENAVQCHICPRNCVITKDKKGFCGVRENRDGKLYSLVYGKACSAVVDPIEKKPLFHFLPSHRTFSIATVGCNLRCLFCQNWEISQPKEIFGEELLPKEVVERAIEEGCDSIAYTYTEPTIFYEYVLETAKLAKKKGLKNVTVTNGYINPKPLKELYRYIDAANVDLKGFTEEYYKDVCGASLAPVLETIKNIHKMDVLLELTNLIVPTKNDNLKDIKAMCEWIVKEVGKEVPLHFSRFYPMYKLSNLEPTPEETLLKAREIALKAGIKYVYIGNIMIEGMENTYCPKCKELLIRRLGFGVVENKVKDGKCSKCKEKIAGVWK